MTAISLTQQDELIIQSYVTTILLVELSRNKFFKSEYFIKEIEFGDENIKNLFCQFGVDTQGVFLMTFYAMLVIPYELFESDFTEILSNLNKTIDKIKINPTSSSYKKDEKGINYIKHIRNSIAHASLKFKPGESVTFYDKYDKTKEECVITLKLMDTEKILNGLQSVILGYIEQVKSKINTV